MAVPTALYSLYLAPIEAYFMWKSVSLFLSRLRANGHRRGTMLALTTTWDKYYETSSAFSVQDCIFWTITRRVLLILQWLNHH